MKIIGTAEAAGRLNVTQSRVRVLIDSGRLKAMKVGREWLIDPKDLDAVKDRKVSARLARAAKSANNFSLNALESIVDTVSMTIVRWGHAKAVKHRQGKKNGQPASRKESGSGSFRATRRFKRWKSTCREVIRRAPQRDSTKSRKDAMG